jgi:hypothetical protein
MTLEIQVARFRQSQKCGMVKPVNGWLIDWCVMPTLAVFQLYSVNGWLIDWCVKPTLAVFQLFSVNDMPTLSSW